MTDNYKLQASVKFGPGQIGMLNVRADDAEEYERNLTAATGLVGNLAVLTEALNAEFQAVSVVTQAFPTTTAAPYNQAPQQAQGGQGVCPHGQMQYKESQDGGVSWKGHFCVLPKGDPGKCKPRYIK